MERVTDNRKVGTTDVATLQPEEEMAALGLQARLTVGAVDDPAEAEADAVAAQVMRHISTMESAPIARELDEEELQMRPAIQRQAPEEEELQMRPAIQRQAPEEEELQMRPAIQRQAPEEEELQMRPAIQRQAPEEEELLQGRRIARADGLEEEELQMRPMSRVAATTIARELDGEELLQGRRIARKQQPGTAPAGVDLDAEEAAGGHTLERHVNVDDSDLAGRTMGGVAAASRFTDKAAAAAAISQVVKDNWTAIEAWVANGCPNGGSAFTSAIAGAGVSLVGNDNWTQPTSKVKVVLRAGANPPGWRVLTAYPEI